MLECLMTAEFEDQSEQATEFSGRDLIQPDAASVTHDEEKSERMRDKIDVIWEKLPEEEQGAQVFTMLRTMLRDKTKGEGEAYDHYLRMIKDVLSGQREGEYYNKYLLDINRLPYHDPRDRQK